MVQSPYPRGTPDRVLGLLTLPQVFGAVQGHGGSTTPIRVGVREKRVHL